MNKIMTKEQKEALNSLIVMLDELDNKPRRLYHALEEVAKAFDKELSRARLEGMAEGAQEVCSEINRTYFFNGNRNDMKMTANHVKDHIVAESYALKKIL
jgi:hypothetical protein